MQMSCFLKGGSWEQCCLDGRGLWDFPVVVVVKVVLIIWEGDQGEGEINVSD